MEITPPEKTIVEDLKKLVRPIVQEIVSKTLVVRPSPSGASSHHEPPKSLTDRPKPSVAPSTPLTVAPSTPPTLASTVPGVQLQDIHELLAQQDQKFQTMLTQVMSHMMSMQGMQTAGPMQFDLSAMDVPMGSSSGNSQSLLGAHGWSTEEAERAKEFHEKEFHEMTAQELSDFSLQERTRVQESEAELTEGPFFWSR